MRVSCSCRVGKGECADDVDNDDDGQHEDRRG